MLRIYHIAAIYRNSPFFEVLPGDLGAYDRWARHIVENGWLGTENFYQDPLYPYLLAVFYKVTGHEFVWIYAVQSLMGACTAAILVMLGSKVFNKRTGILAGLLYSLYGPALYFDGLLFKVSLAQMAYVISVIIFYVFSRYRMVVLPLFCVSAAFGFFMIYDQVRMARWRKLAVSLLILAISFGIGRLQIIEPFNFSHSFMDEGIAYEMIGEEHKALQSYEQALDINPGYMRALEKMAPLQLQLKQHDKARQTFDRILAIDPDSVEAKYQIMLLDKLGL